MRVSRASLKTLLQNNIAEIKFKRRRLKIGHPPTRRMLCTCSLPLLNSPKGRIALNFRPAYNQPKFNYDQKDLVLVWDILMQDYRLVSMNACELFNVVPVANFWNFFNMKLALMSRQAKIAFMRS